MSSEFEKTEKIFKIKMRQQKISDNYKKSSEQWKKLYEEEHKKLFNLKSAIKEQIKKDGNFMCTECGYSSLILQKLLDIIIETCKHGTPIDMECTRCLTDSELLLP